MPRGRRYKSAWSVSLRREGGETELELTNDLFYNRHRTTKGVEVSITFEVSEALKIYSPSDYRRNQEARAR